MTNYTKNFMQEVVNEFEKNNSDAYENITIRLEYEYFSMIKNLSGFYKFPISTAFTDIISGEVYELTKLLSEEEKNEISEIISKIDNFDLSGSIARLKKEEVLEVNSSSEVTEEELFKGINN